MNRTTLCLLMATATLALLGAAALYSALMAQIDSPRFAAHLCWLGIGAALCVLSAGCNYTWWGEGRRPWVGLGVALVLLVLVLCPGIGERVNGARRWFRLGGQPSEFAKLALVVALASYCALHQGGMRRVIEGFAAPAALAAATAGLIFLEPDWGTALLVLLVAGTMLWVGGARSSCLLVSGLALLVLLVVFVREDPVRLARFLTYLDPERYQHGPTWQVWHSILALGVGGWHGSSLGLGAHKFGFVPEQQTDFIFSLIGEELGLCGTGLVLVLLLTIVYCGWSIAWRAPDPFGQMLALGITCLIGFQALINLGVVTGVLPNKGIPLPFISYGGSNLLCMFICVGLLLSLGRRPRDQSAGGPLDAPQNGGVPKGD